MEQRQTISEISEHIALEMERLQYSPLTILDFQRKAKHLGNCVQGKLEQIISVRNWAKPIWQTQLDFRLRKADG